MRNHLLFDCPIWPNKRHDLQMLYGPMELNNLTTWIKRTEFNEFIEGIHWQGAVPVFKRN